MQAGQDPLLPAEVRGHRPPHRQISQRHPAVRQVRPVGRPSVPPVPIQPRTLSSHR